MGASLTRRWNRAQARQAKKVFNRISQQTLDQINRQPPEERDKLLLLYKKMLEQKDEQRKKKEAE
jgi:hypothetical protein